MRIKWRIGNSLVSYGLIDWIRYTSCVLPNKLCFVDVETTGMRSTYDRIIEIGALRVEENRVVKTFTSLINPDKYLPPEIVSLTGITPADLENAPSFREIKDEIQEMFEDAILVAHNVRFDYGFIKNEFKRLGLVFSPKHFCTVKLSRSLFPEFNHHNLDAIMERFKIKSEVRHRAFNDAAVLWEFYQKIQKKFTEEVLIEAVNRALLRPTLPINLPPDTLDSLPEAPGVYIFYGAGGVPLYVGKSVSIRDRVLSHFSSDHSSSKEMKIAQQIESIETIETAGELGALLLEASLVKKMQPMYNRMLRVSRKLVVLIQKQTQEGYNSVDFETPGQINVADLDKIVGIFRSMRQAKECLINLAREHELCERLLKTETTSTSCFGYRLGRCKGACVGKESALRYNMRFIIAFSHLKIRNWPFEGPVVIKEENPLNEYFEGYLVDKWCYLGTLSKQADPHELMTQEFNFDVDTYKIIERYLRDPRNQANIKPLPFVW